MDEVRVLLVRRTRRAPAPRDRAGVLGAGIEDVVSGIEREYLVILVPESTRGLLLRLAVVRDVVVVIERLQATPGKSAVLVGIVDGRVEDVAVVVAGSRAGGSDSAV